MNDEAFDQAMKRQAEIIAQAMQIIVQLEINNYELKELARKRGMQ